MNPILIAPRIARSGRWHTIGARRGISLLEVLVAMFIMMVGMAGIAALLPVGRQSVVETAKADRSAACGRAALREIKIRGWLDPANWVWIATSNPYDWNDRIVTNTALSTNNGTSFMIDPLYLATNNYPANRNGGYAYCADTLTRSPRIPRITLLNRPIPLATGLQAVPRRYTYSPDVVSPPLATRLFTWEDDLSFDVGSAASQRTRPLYMVYGATSGTVRAAPLPIIAADNIPAIANNDVILQSVADSAYSWMITASPMLQEQSVPLTSSRAFTVSAVVFYHRNLTPPSGGDAKPCERAVALTQSELNGAFGWGGGMLILRESTARQQYLDFNPNEWLMVVATRVDPFNSNRNSHVLQWYRVVSNDNVVDPTNSRNRNVLVHYVTVVGPDWTDLWDNTRYANPMVVLMTGVVGVYQTTVQLDRSATWSQ